MTPSEHPQDELLIADALLRYSCRLEDVEPERADRALILAEEIVAVHGLTLQELPDQIDNDIYAGRGRIR